MTLNELDKYFRSFLKIEDFAADPAMNGIQIKNSNNEIVYDAIHTCIQDIVHNFIDTVHPLVIDLA